MQCVSELLSREKDDPVASIWLCGKSMAFFCLARAFILSPELSLDGFGNILDSTI